ncbi:MAG: ABC transporter ATP-binding protein [Planctomycetes bacterium]|nr:ABC transporter ATP-binding protein [Planctomycetota bacterium]
MIRLEAISRTFVVGTEPVHALRGLSEHVRPGEYVAIMGPSGSGKSTLLHIIGCLDRPTAGVYRLDGETVSELDETALTAIRREKIGFVFQSYHLVGRLDAAGNVELPMVFAGVPRGERRSRAAAALEGVGMAGRTRHRPHQLSGGERQRVAIARATVMRPAILLADEPTGNLDSAAGQQVMAVLRRMNAEGLTLVVVTHDPDVAREAERVVVLKDGRVGRRLTGSELPASGSGK